MKVEREHTHGQGSLWPHDLYFVLPTHWNHSWNHLPVPCLLKKHLTEIISELLSPVDVFVEGH